MPAHEWLVWVDTTLLVLAFVAVTMIVFILGRCHKRIELTIDQLIQLVRHDLLRRQPTSEGDDS